MEEQYALSVYGENYTLYLTISIFTKFLSNRQKNEAYRMRKFIPHTAAPRL